MNLAIRPGCRLVLARHVRAYVRREHGRTESVRTYVTQGGWIPEPDWKEGQQIWKQRGAAARVRDEAKEQHAYGVLDEARFSAWRKHVESTLRQEFRAGHETHIEHTVNHDGHTYTPERAAAHRDIIQEVLRNARHVPAEHKAVMTGGLPGAGKSTSLQQLYGKDMGKNYYTVSSDDMKEALARRGLIPTPRGLSPMEASLLTWKESNDLADLAGAALAAQGKNMVIDGTMSNADMVRKRIDTLHRGGYEVHGVFVKVPLDVATTRASARYRHDLEEYRQGRGMGGRDVPQQWERSRYGDPHSKKSSRPERAFHQLQGSFDKWDEFDNTQPGQLSSRVRSSYSGATEQEARAAEKGTLAVRKAS